jgi:predicted dehydrogenase
LTTAQLGQPERLDIVGTRGALRLDPSGLVFEEAPVDLRTFAAESPEPFGKLPLNPVPVELEPGTGDHAAVYANFIDAIRGHAPLLIDGAQAQLSLELANAMILSSSSGQPVSLPLDRQAYAELLADLRARSLAHA